MTTRPTIIRLIAPLLLIAMHLGWGYSTSYDGKTLCFAELFEIMMNDAHDSIGKNMIGSPAAYYGTSEMIQLKHCNIVFDRERDNFWDLRYSNGGERIRITKAIELLDCEFPLYYWFLVRGVDFEQPLILRDCRNVKFIFKDCRFQSTTEYRACTGEFVQFLHCQLDYGFFITEKCDFSNLIRFDSCILGMNAARVRHSQNREHLNVIKNLSRVPPYFHVETAGNPFELRITNSDFRLDTTLLDSFPIHVGLSNCGFTSMILSNSRFNLPVDLSFVNVEQQCNIHNVTFYGSVLSEAFSFNPSNARVEWKCFAGNKLAVLDDHGQKYTGNNILDAGEEYVSKNLISVYANFYQMYRSQGDRLAANASYIEWKDIETQYLSEKMKNNPELTIRFTYWMNIFLRIFCDYGTNPIKSVYWSGLVLASFALFYLLSPSESGTLNNDAFLRRVREYGTYFSHGERLADIERRLLPGEVKVYTDEQLKLRTYLAEHHLSLPSWYRLFTIRIRKASLPFRLWLAIGLDKAIGPWATASSMNRLFIWCILGFLMMMNWIGDILIRFLDACSTSLNAFSTLGFGEIPLKGAAKYLAIIEGFTGWFLLSIFSVALISQILQ